MILYWLGMFGIAAFAITGVISSGKRDMDLFSLVVLGMVTSLGGGTIRDVILSVETVYWVKDTSYLWVAAASSVFAFFAVRFIENRQTIFHYADSFGLALFTVVATENVLRLGFSATIAVTMGVITGIAGGIIRDLLSNRAPLVLGREFYATPALLGALFIVLLNDVFPSHPYNAIYATTLIVVLRLFAIHKGLYYPSWLLYKKRAATTEELPHEPRK
ncbi:trimeric intracellular cation channel family protein [Maribrevibacterium harenarium]|uniref:Trimeric intracellular cation channel family protein n=1 Tax=Maribrevibacterium harenarium TaxID=2589817 RepID=A0A501X1Z0_9GAMM|nr:trimeric intracellular cation channel family protein [Maribrevibacterium harenarium]TPE54491.1 trimeric intracellular cation channel family protein [Maribrevibacterium harenarium]